VGGPRLGGRAGSLPARDPGRPALGIRVGDAAAGRVAERNAYAKVYGDAEKGRQGAHAQRDLHDRAAAGAAFAVAEPIAYVERLQTLVQGEVGGVSLHALLRQRDDPTPALRAAARAVAGFHRLDLAAPPRRAGKEIPRPLRKAQERLRSERPDLAREVAGLLEAVAVGLGGVPPGPTHGDLKPNHILLDGDRVALIDFDDLAEGDPLRDVANLVAQLAQIRSTTRQERRSGCSWTSTSPTRRRPGGRGSQLARRAKPPATGNRCGAGARYERSEPVMRPRWERRSESGTPAPRRSRVGTRRRS
jgi:hypothetical protein